MISVRETILAAWFTVLATVTAPTVPGPISVYRARRSAVADARLPALVMASRMDPPEQLTAMVTRNVERITVTAMAKAAGDAALDSALADLTAAVQRAIDADPTLGGLAVDAQLVDADQGLADDEGAGFRGEAALTYAVEYWTRPGDPYTAAP